MASVPDSRQELLASFLSAFESYEIPLRRSPAAIAA
jgi:hypothetical protein